MPCPSGLFYNFLFQRAVAKNVIKKIKSLLYKSPLRKVFRFLGLGRLIMLVSKLRLAAFKWRSRNRSAKGAERVNINDTYLNFCHSSHFELFRLSHIGGEKKLIQILLDNTRSGDVVFDIGANIGIYSLFLAKKVGRGGQVISFEPEKHSRTRLLKNIEINAVENVRVFETALGETETMEIIEFSGEAGSGVHRVLGQDDRESPTHQQNISVSLGDRIIDDHSLPSPNIVKIDVEGMEYEVLKGISRTLKHPDCRFVLCEIHFSLHAKSGREDTPHRIEDILLDSGFSSIEWADPSHLIGRKIYP